MYRNSFVPRGGWRFGIIILPLSLAGCTEQGIDRYPVTGTVTFEGRPVEAGMIIFEPTESVGIVAPTVYLPIKQGKYDAGNDGPTKGKYRVVVGGMDRSREKSDSDGMLITPSLFPDYRAEVEIPPPNNTLDIEVPASRASRRK